MCSRVCALLYGCDLPQEVHNIVGQSNHLLWHGLASPPEPEACLQPWLALLLQQGC